MDWLEEAFLETQDKKPWAYFRYIDDIFIIWNEGEESLRQFLESFNKFHPSIKFEWKYTTDQVKFLDVRLSLEGETIEFDLYTKPTDCHQYLHFESCHPFHTTICVVYSQALQIQKRCSQEIDVKQHLDNLESWFIDRKYPKNLVKGQIRKAVEETKRRTMEVPSVEHPKCGSGIPLVLTYHPALSKFSEKLNKHVFDI